MQKVMLQHTKRHPYHERFIRMIAALTEDSYSWNNCVVSFCLTDPGYLGECCWHGAGRAGAPGTADIIVSVTVAFG